jgi:hypothetical protein
MNINILKARSMSIQADACDIEAEIAGMEALPDFVDHHIKCASTYRKLAADYNQMADKDEKRGSK